jgi:hypothetical protein
MDVTNDRFTNICIRIAHNAEAIANNAENTKLWKRSGGVDFSRHQRRMNHLCKMRSMLHAALEADVMARYPQQVAA